MNSVVKVSAIYKMTIIYAFLEASECTIILFMISISIPGFGTPSDLRKHNLLHTAPRELQYKKGPFFCQFCPEVKFNVRQGLYYHMKKLHSDKYLFNCSKCGKGYAMKSSLSQHEKECKSTKIGKKQKKIHDK